MPRTVTFRPIVEDDREFLYRVYASTREEELAQTDWTAEQTEAFLRMQFQAQHDYYQQNWPDARYDVILQDGEPIGRLYVDRRPAEIRIMDVALLTAHRGGGIGGQIMQDLLQEGCASGRPVNIHVLKTNMKAQRFYHRLGFREVADVGGHLLMEFTQGESTHGD